MKVAIPVVKNQTVALSIASLSSEGHGVGRINGFAVFVPGALPGETVTVLIIKVASSYAVGKLLSVEAASPARVAPRCPVFSQCGGCELQHASYAMQLAEKRRIVVDALTRLGDVSNAEALVSPVLGMDEPWHYRNKGALPFAYGPGGRVCFGCYAARSHRVIPVAECAIQDARIASAAQAVAAWAEECRVPLYDEATGRGVLRHIVARAASDGGVMSVIVTTGALPKRDVLLERLETAGAADSVWHNVNAAHTNVIFGESFTLLAGSERLAETMGHLRFSVGPQSFLQVNPAQTLRLYDTAVEMLAARPTDTVLDVYCGIGTISLLVADRVARVVGIEQVAPAVDDARENARLNGAANAEFICGSAEDVLPRLVSEGLRPDGILLDPPRKGCDERALAALADSGAPRIAYVSCNPSTLARDVKYLMTRGYALAAAQPVDMFPQTVHVETVVLMLRR